MMKHNECDYYEINSPMVQFYNDKNELIDEIDIDALVEHYLETLPE